MSLARGPKQYMGVRAIAPPDLQKATRAPTSSDTAYVPGTLWLDTDADAVYMWPGSGNWISLGSGTTGAVVTLTGDSGGAIAPVGGNIDIVGTANQLAFAGTAGTLTGSLSATLVAPGSITSTTTMTAGTDLASTAGNVLINGSAKQLRIKGGAATDFIGTATLVNGTATVLNTNIAAGDRIFVERSAVNASTALGVFKVVKSAGVNFVITACKPADATTETGDVSTVEYVIIRQI